jgi:hypothetical protein
MMRTMTKKYIYLGIVECWDYEYSKGFEVLPIAVSEYSGSMLAYERMYSDDKWTSVHFDLLYWNVCATMLDKASKNWDAMFDFTL